MKNPISLLAFQGWIYDLFDSQWLYLAIAGVFFLVLIVASLHLIPKKKKSKKRKPVASIPPADTQKSEPDDYNSIVDTAQKVSQQSRCLLLAGNSLESLPVTIPVNLAIKLAQSGKCLLIDLDTKRDAISKVFDLNADEMPANLKVSSLETPVENLSVWPARNFDFLKQMNLRGLLDGANKKYDHVLIYAPYLTTLADRKQIATSAKYAVAFTGQEKTNSQLVNLLNACNCKVVQTF
jgi:hypothetical protein